LHEGAHACAHAVRAYAPARLGGSGYVMAHPRPPVRGEPWARPVALSRVLLPPHFPLGSAGEGVGRVPPTGRQPEGGYTRAGGMDEGVCEGVHECAHACAHAGVQGTSWRTHREVARPRGQEKGCDAGAVGVAERRPRLQQLEHHLGECVGRIGRGVGGVGHFCIGPLFVWGHFLYWAPFCVESAAGA
jgi:hypothetical protein